MQPTYKQKHPTKRQIHHQTLTKSKPIKPVNQTQNTINLSHKNNRQKQLKTLYQSDNQANTYKTKPNTTQPNHKKLPNEHNNTPIQLNNNSNHTKSANAATQNKAIATNQNKPTPINPLTNPIKSQRIKPYKQTLKSKLNH